MSHILDNHKTISARINRIIGQLKTVESKLAAGEDSYQVLQTLSASRGALNGLISEIMEGHIRHHIMSNPDKAETAQDTAALELARLIKTYWK